jgi:hypothetical protein
MKLSDLSLAMNSDASELERRTELVVAEYGGIVPYCETFYIHSIIYSADLANKAFRRFRRACRNNASKTVVVSAVHEALGHAASLSRFFWPSRDGKIAKARAGKLRLAFALDESSPLRNRHLRDSLEHFDERLDRFLLKNDDGYFFPTPLVGNHALADDASGRIFKLVDPTGCHFVVLNEKYCFEALPSEVQRVLALAQRMSHNGRL